MRLPVNQTLPLAALVLLGAGSAFAAPANGPAADYPVVVGEPFTIDSTVWTPVDQLNYDAVGLAAAGEGAGVTAAHKTLPLPCYVEVTSLETGRTILVRIERRGPMSNDVLVELSGEAAAQLGLAPGAKGAVRIRRVNPPEQERAMLRAGNRAPERMETPEGLLKVLRRKMADQSPLLPPPSIPPTMPKAEPPADLAKATTTPAPKTPPKQAVATPAPLLAPKPSPAPVAKAPPKQAAQPAAAPSRSAAKGSLVVQVATFSVEASARKVAAQVGGAVVPAGKFWRVRLGPYPNRAQAAPALEKARRAGYSDARIQSAD